MTASTSPHPFPESLWQDVRQLLERLDERQALWLSGYLAARSEAGAALPGGAGVAAVAGGTPAQRTAGAGNKARALVAFGGETGNSESLARRLAELAGERGIPVEVADLASMRVRQLGKRERIVVICSTHGDGDPPEPVHDFYDALMDDSAPALPNLHFAVLALGDSSYDQFCVTGQQLDQRLEALGGQRFAARRDCDVDYEVPAREWMEEVLAKLAAETGPSSEHAAAAAPDAAAQAPAAQTVEYSKQHPLTVEVLENVCLSASERHSPVHHLELALEDAEFHIQPGDAVGVLAGNPPELVAAILDATDLSGEQPVTIGGAAVPLVQALREHCDLTIPSKRLLEFWASLNDSEELVRQLEADTKTQRAFLRSHQIIDLTSRYPARPEAQALVDSLRPLQPRLYDVANSLAAVEDELHLTVKHYHYDFGDREETGIASDYLLQLQPGDSVQIYPHRNVRFQLPDASQPNHDSVPLILVADGTGIAPYRAFLQEIEAAGRSNPCWLVFSEQRFEDDFLYQLDWQEAHHKGLLQRIDSVFFQDQPGRSLSQPLLDQPAQLLDWLADGAHIYLCGDKDLLTQCEQDIQALFDEAAGPELSWKQLNSARRIHRNLY